MKTHWMTALIGAMALTLAACGDRTADNAPSTSPDDTTAAPMADVPAAAEQGAGDAAPADLVCVKDVPADSICTMDINQCGNSSGCNCGDGYDYNAALGKCVLDLDGVGEATPVSVEDGECVAAAAGACTRDINACGFPSRCDCADGFDWNPVVGKCLMDVSRG